MPRAAAAEKHTELATATVELEEESTAAMEVPSTVVVAAVHIAVGVRKVIVEVERAEDQAVPAVPKSSPSPDQDVPARVVDNAGFAP